MLDPDHLLNAVASTGVAVLVFIMVAALVLAGVCLFALLIGDISCVPVQKGNDPAAYKEGYRYAGSAPGFFPQPAPRSGPGSGPPPAPRSGPGFVPRPAPRSGPGFVPQPAPRSGPGSGPPPAPRSGLRSGPQPPAQTGHYSPPSYNQVPRSSKLTDPAPVQPSDQAPAGFDSVPAAYSDQYLSRGGVPPDVLPLYDPAPGHMNTEPAKPSGVFVKPPSPDGIPQEPLAPEGPFVERPEPAYQAGELSHYEGTAEHGFYEQESEEQGSPPRPPPYPFGPPPPPPPPYFSPPGAGMSSFPYPRPPYPYFPPYYYDYRFLAGQYPPGTYTHARSNYDHGLDGWKDVHYLREHIPYQAEPVQQSEIWYPPVPQPGKVPIVFGG